MTGGWRYLISMILPQMVMSCRRLRTVGAKPLKQGHSDEFKDTMYRDGWGQSKTALGRGIA
jgi:hypothetical protein